MRHARPRQRVARIDGRRPLVVIDRAPARRRRPLVREVPSAQVEIVGVGALRLPPRHHVELRWGQAQSDLFRDRRAHLSLQPQEVGGRVIVGLRPHVFLIPHANQLGRDPQVGALGPNRTLEEVVDRELLADLGGRLRRPLVSQGAALDAQARGIDPRERCARLFGEAVGQVLALRIVPDVLERQHGERDPRTRCARTAAVPPDENRGSDQGDGNERGEHGNTRRNPPPRRHPPVRELPPRPGPAAAKRELRPAVSPRPQPGQ